LTVPPAGGLGPLADQGAVVFLEKPYSPHDLTAKVGLLLDTARR
jgi:hypothetical protein